MIPGPKLATALQTRVLISALVVVGAVGGGGLAVNAMLNPDGPPAIAAPFPSPVASASPDVTERPPVPAEIPIYVMIASDTVNPAALRYFANLCMQVNESRINCSSTFPQGTVLDAASVTTQIFGTSDAGLLFWGCDEPSPSGQCHRTVDRPKTVAVTTTTSTDKKYADEFDAMYREGKLDRPPPGS